MTSHDAPAVTADFTAPCGTCGRTVQYTAGAADADHVCQPEDTGRHQAHLAGWEEGYKFALLNSDDEAVQTDRGRYVAEAEEGSR
jgi:hypothetical protein